MDNCVSLFVMSVPVGMVLNPGVIPSRMVGYPVENDSHTMLVAYLCKVLEIVDSAEFWSDGFVVADAIWGVLAFFNAYRIDGHYPHDIDA